MIATKNFRSISFILINIFFVILMSVSTNAEDDGGEELPVRLESERLIERYSGEEDTGDADFFVSNPETAIVPWSNITYQSFRNNNWEIYFVDNDISHPRRLTNNDYTDIHPNLSRGGTRIVFSSYRNGDYELFSMNTDGSNLVQLTFNNANDVNPQWSPDGTKIVFESYRDGQAEIYVMNANGGGLNRLTTHSEYDIGPSWSPNGEKIAFSSSRSGGFRIFTINVDGSGLTQLSTQPISLHPTWSPDGNQIAFDADGDGDGWQDLWVMNSDGSNQRAIFNPAGQQDTWARSWSPDGQYVSFTQISFIQYQGNWFWTKALIRGYNLTTNGIAHLSNHSLERDWNPSWQSTDITAPTSQVDSLEAYSPANGFRLFWDGTDFAESGIKGFDIQYRIGENGNWVEWKNGTTNISDAYSGTVGTLVQFRSRAYDQMYNYEPWPVNFDTETRFYTWDFSGTVVDNRGVPLSGIELNVNPSPWETSITDENGQYQTFLLQEGVHSLQIQNANYAPTIETDLLLDKVDSIYLQPLDNVVTNGNFESSNANILNWGTTGALPIDVTTEYFHTGTNSVKIGADCTALCLGGSENFQWADYAEIDLVTDNQGNLHLLWHGAILGETAYPYYSFRDIDGNWSDPLQLGNEFASDQHVGAFSPDGVLHVFWTNRDDEVFYTKRFTDGSWSETEIIFSNEGNVTDVVIDSDGNIFVLLQKFNVEAGLLQLTNNGNWKYTEIVDDQTRYAVMTIDSHDQIHFSWSVDLNSSSHRFPIYHQIRYPNGQLSQRESLFKNVDYFVPRAYELLVSEDDTIHLIWRASNELYHAYHTKDGDWTNPFRLPKSHSTPNAVIDSQGILHLANNDRGGNEGVYYRRWRPDSGWEAPFTITSEYPHRVPSVALDQNDVVHLTWTEGAWDGVKYRSTTRADSTQTGILEQSVSIPQSMSNPTLSFMTKAIRDVSADSSGLKVFINNQEVSYSTQSVSIGPIWTQYWVDMTPWQGQTVDVTFHFHQESGDVLSGVIVDEISLGSSYPDIWSQLISSIEHGVPNELFELTVVYGNQSSLPVVDGSIAVNLPPNVEFQSSNIAPTSIDPLIWDVGDLPSNSNSSPIVITVKIDQDAPFFNTLEISSEIYSNNQELQTNNKITTLRQWKY